MASAAELAALISVRNEGSAEINQFRNSIEGVSGSFLGIPNAATAAAVGIGALTAAMAAVAVKGFELGSAFDEAFDAIAIKSGATGERLAALQEDFRAVAASVPADFGQVSEAIGAIAARTGQSGEALQALAAQTLNLSRLTGEGLGETIRSTTRLFGDWGITTDQQSLALDKLLVASQSTGTSVNQLAQNVVQFGAPMRQLGFSFEEAVSLLAKFEAEGVNTETVMSTMRIAVAKFAEAGVDGQTAFRDLIADIQAMEDPMAATAIAMEIFGKKGGADMAAAIREGRFGIDEMVAALGDAEGAIAATADNTDDAQQRMQIAMNEVALAFEPAATAIFELAGSVADALVPVVESQLVPIIQMLSSELVEFVANPGAKFNEWMGIAEGHAGGLETSMIKLGDAFSGLGGLARGAADTASQALADIKKKMDEVAENPIVAMLLEGAGAAANVAAFGATGGRVGANPLVGLAGPQPEELDIEKLLGHRPAETLGPALAEMGTDIVEDVIDAIDTATANAPTPRVARDAEWWRQRLGLETTARGGGGVDKEAERLRREMEREQAAAIREAERILKEQERLAAREAEIEAQRANTLRDLADRRISTINEATDAAAAAIDKANAKEEEAIAQTLSQFQRERDIAEQRKALQDEAKRGADELREAQTARRTAVTDTRADEDRDRRRAQEDADLLTRRAKAVQANADADRQAQQAVRAAQFGGDSRQVLQAMLAAEAQKKARVDQIAEEDRALALRRAREDEAVEIQRARRAEDLAQAKSDAREMAEAMKALNAPLEVFNQGILQENLDAKIIGYTQAKLAAIDAANQLLENKTLQAIAAEEQGVARANNQGLSQQQIFNLYNTNYGYQGEEAVDHMLADAFQEAGDALSLGSAQ